MNDADQDLLEYVGQLKCGSILDPDEIVVALGHICQGMASKDATVAFLGALTPNTITPQQLAAAVKFMQPGNFLPIRVDVGMAGTGGTRLKRPNTTSAAGLLLASHGLTVLNHGNRGSCEADGSTDFFDALTDAGDLSFRRVEESVAESGFGYVSVREFFQPSEALLTARKEIAGPTIFNLCGPLLTFAEHTTLRVVGLASPELFQLFEETVELLFNMNYPVDRVLLVSGCIGEGQWIDEFSTCGLTGTSLITKDCAPIQEQFVPGDFGLSSAKYKDVCRYSKSGRSNAEIFACIAEACGQRHAKAIQLLEWLCINAGMVLYFGGGSRSIRTGRDVMMGHVFDGLLQDVLEKFKKAVN